MDGLIAAFEEDRLAPNASRRNVVRDAVDDDTGEAGHVGNSARMEQ